jgi:hypothetical protein
MPLFPDRERSLAAVVENNRSRSRAQIFGLKGRTEIEASQRVAGNPPRDAAFRYGIGGDTSTMDGEGDPM